MTLAAEWWGVLDRVWHSIRHLVFVNLVINKTLGICRTRDIRARVTKKGDLWERGLVVVLV